jgi:hypothetical protein
MLEELLGIAPLTPAYAMNPQQVSARHFSNAGSFCATARFFNVT